MALLRYLKPIDGLPDPKGPLTSYISAQAIAEANKEVQKATSHSSATKKKRGNYKKYIYCHAIILASLTFITIVCKISTYTIFRRVVLSTKIKPRENLKLVVKLQPFGTKRVIQIEVPGQAMKPQERIVVVLVY